jgi:hypothetical protein
LAPPKDMDKTLVLLKGVSKALDALAHKTGRKRCWCEHGVGNPMMPEHSTACLDAQLILEYAEQYVAKFESSGS